jgi:hypothetical protein
MHRMETACGQPMLDRTTAEAKASELPATDDAVLTVGDASDRPLVWSDVSYVRPRISW